MKIKLDENLPSTLGGVLARLGHDVETVSGEGLKGRKDPEIWKVAQSEGRFLITQDLDFSDVRTHAPGSHRGVLLLRLTHPGRRALVERVRSLFQTENVDQWVSCIVVATEHKLRVRGPEADGRKKKTR